MKPKSVYAVHPAGFLVEFELDETEHVADAVELLVEREYRPSHGDAWPRTPDGVPICPKHGEVMAQREKQGDTWYSHKVTDEHGEVLYCRGYPGKSSPGFSVPPVKRKGESQQQPPSAQQQQARGRQQPPPPPTAVQGELPGTPPAELPDYRAMAVNAKTDHEFDYAAYMTLRNGVYDSVERVTKTHRNLFPDWKPAPRTNTALLLALEVYRDKRSAAEARGEAAAAAHSFAKREAMGAYNREMGG